MADSLVNAAHHVLDTIKHATVATVSADGQPWNTPVYFARRGNTLYWTSTASAQHSLNIRDNGRTFVVVYDSSRRDASGAAVYLETNAVELSDARAIDAALEAIYQRKQKTKPPASGFQAGSPHRVYEATVRRVWTNLLHTGDEHPWDERVEIVLET